MNNNSTSLELQAIQAAKTQDWEAAIECNQAMIVENSQTP